MSEEPQESVPVTEVTTPALRAKSPDHTARGKFAPGNNASHANERTQRHMQVWKRARDQAITVEGITAVINTLFKRAIDGEQWACELIISARFIPKMPEDASSQSGAAPVQIQVIMPGALHRQMMEIGRTTPPVPGLGLLPEIEGEPEREPKQ